MKKTLQIYLYLLPALSVVALVFLYSGYRLIFTSLHDATFSQDGNFVGLKNYFSLLSPDVTAVFLRTGWWIILTVLPTMAVGLIGALLLNQTLIGRNVLRSLIFIPWLIPQSLIAVLWRWTFHSAYGVVNNILIASGILTEGINFLNVERAFMSSVLMRIWRTAPFAIVCILAGLQSIPKGVNEAAELDGASPLQRLIHITTPMIGPILVVTAVYLTIWTTIVFDMIYVLTGGGPLNATEIFGIRIYKETFMKNRMGVASALSTLGIAVLILFDILYMRFKSKKPNS